VPFAAVLKKLKALQCNSWVTAEQGVLPGTYKPQEDARRNCEYLTKFEANFRGGTA
jgi:hypothetical protein